MKQKGSSDVKGSLWNHLDKKVLLWHREAPLFLRVYMQPFEHLIGGLKTDYMPPNIESVHTFLSVQKFFKS